MFWQRSQIAKLIAVPIERVEIRDLAFDVGLDELEVGNLGAATLDTLNPLMDRAAKEK